jgi:hypothetical protein
MDFSDRLAAYADRHVSASGQAVYLRPDDIDGPATEADHSWLTPAERRRLRHKRNSRKTHSHEGLLVTLDEHGTPRLQPCSRCSPPKRKRQLVGGVQ